MDVSRRESIVEDTISYTNAYMMETRNSSKFNEISPYSAQHFYGMKNNSFDNIKVSKSSKKILF